MPPWKKHRLILKTASQVFLVKVIKLSFNLLRQEQQKPKGVISNGLFPFVVFLHIKTD